MKVAACGVSPKGKDVSQQSQRADRREHKKRKRNGSHHRGHGSGHAGNWRRRGCELFRKLRQQTQWRPSCRAHRLDLRLTARATLANPLTQLLKRHRAVLFAVGSTDFEHGYRVSRRSNQEPVWNAPFTSGFISTTKAQMPIGQPIRQHGETHGTMAMMEAVIAKL